MSEHKFTSIKDFLPDSYGELRIFPGGAEVQRLAEFTGELLILTDHFSGDIDGVMADAERLAVESYTDRRLVGQANNDEVGTAGELGLYLNDEFQMQRAVSGLRPGDIIRREVLSDDIHFALLRGLRAEFQDNRMMNLFRGEAIQATIGERFVLRAESAPELWHNPHYTWNLQRRRPDLRQV